MNVVETKSWNMKNTVVMKIYMKMMKKCTKDRQKSKKPVIEGSRIVKAREISINGIYEETVVIDEKITSEPLSAIVYRGMKERPRTLAY